MNRLIRYGGRLSMCIQTRYLFEFNPMKKKKKKILEEPNGPNGLWSKTRIYEEASV